MVMENVPHFPVSTKSRNTKGVISIKVSDRNGKVVAATQVEENRSNYADYRCWYIGSYGVSEISIVGRNTQGVRLIRTTETRTSR